MSVLHFTRSLPALLPRYVTRFSCIGPECPDNCCTGWHVAIDKKTFNAYRQTKQPELSVLFAKNVKRQRSQASDANYARIELNAKTRECPMMQERLCAVQKNLDESYLSDTCFSYPVSRNFGGQQEQALTLSCPEAARLALLDPQAFDFVEGLITVRSNTVSTVLPKQGIPLETMNEVRIFCLQLVRTQGLELWQKLAVLGVFCESLTSTLAKGEHTAVLSLLDSFTMMVENGLVLDALAEMKPNHPVQARVFSVLWQRKTSHSSSPVQNQVFAAVAKGLGADTETAQVSPEQLLDCYSRGVGRLPEALKAAPHLLENYILNEMFCDLFPFNGASPYEHYLQLVSRFGWLADARRPVQYRGRLAGRCRPGADGACILPAFPVNLGFASQVNLALKNTGWATLEKVFGFLRS